jgi:SgrR family transcriptional regulator
MRLLDHYRRLHRLLSDAATPPSLPELAEAMNCSQRNIRLLLNRMQAEGWLSWQPGRGRGRRSSLTLLKPPEQLAFERLGGLLADGDLERAFGQLDPAQRRELAARLPDFLGAPAGLGRLRMPLYRAPASLDPLHVKSRVEGHLVRQVFSRLCSYDRERQRLMPALAHHWESSDDGCSWRFWLRPGLRFHDGRELDAHDVQHTLLRLRDTPSIYQRTYRHLLEVEVHQARSFSCHLAVSDYLWPHRQGSANASIVPRRRAADFARRPVGSGPFKVLRHNEYRITLQAYEQYYRERALLDEIDLWIVPPPDSGQRFDIEFGYPSEEGMALPSIRQLQSGCSYLVCNPQRACFAAPEQRLALLRWLQPARLFGQSVQRVPANGLLPEWQHLTASPAGAAPLPPGTSLRLVTYQLDSMVALAQALKERMAQDGVALECRILPFSEYAAGGWRGEADLVLANEVFHDDQEYGCYEWFACESVFRQWLPRREFDWLDGQLVRLQALPDSPTRRAVLAEIGLHLVEQGWLLPLAHEVQQLRVQPHVGGLEPGPFGMTVLNELWLRD